MAFRPGTLTRNYVMGKRGRYISPVALFLFTVFLMFFVFSVLGGEPKTSANAAPASSRAALEKARAQLDVNEAKSKEKGDKRALEDIAISKSILDSALKSDKPETRGVTATVDDDGEVSVVVNPNGGKEAIFAEIRAASASDRLKINTGLPELDQKIRHKLENPELAWYKLQNTAYKFSFLLVPLSLPFVWLVFAWKRGVTLFDHVVFLLYSLSFMSVLFIGLALAGQAPTVLAGWITPVLAFSPPVHIFFQVKGAYALSIFSALWRTLFLLVAAAISLVLFVLAILMLGLAG